MSERSKRSRFLFAAVLAALLVGLALWWNRARPEPSGAKAAGSVAATPIPPPRPVDNPPLPTASPAPAAGTAVPASASTTSRATKVATAPEEIRRTIAENLVPGRMVFLDFVLDGSGIRMVAATGASGRAKSTGVLNPGFGWVHYDLFGADGALLQQGSVPDPTRQRVEFPANSDDGKIASKVVFAEQGPLAVRLPGELAIARIEFYRDRNPATPGGVGGREVLGTFDLRGPP